MIYFQLNNLGECITVGGPSAGSKCKFPFIFASQRYDKCTSDGGVGAFWCATEINSDSGEMIHGKWGICDDYCARYGKLSTILTMECNRL